MKKSILYGRGEKCVQGLFEKPEGKSQLRKPRPGREKSIKINVK
jgi:hypothetical protein